MSEPSFDAPNYTQVPNVFLDDLLTEIDTLGELKVTLAIIRATFGWHKDEDCLSFSQLQKRSGLSRQAVNDGVSAALKRGFVRRRKEGQAFYYSIAVQNLDSPGGRPVAGQESRPVDANDACATGQESRPTKETTTSKETEKESARPEVERLCQLMAELANERTDPEHKRKRPKYAVTKRWRDEMRRLIDIDGRSPELIERAIRWVHDNTFWRKNIFAPEKLREQFDRIFLEAQEEKSGRRPSRRGSKADSIDSKVETLRRGARS